MSLDFDNVVEVDNSVALLMNDIADYLGQAHPPSFLMGQITNLRIYRTGKARSPTTNVFVRIFCISVEIFKVLSLIYFN